MLGHLSSHRALGMLPTSRHTEEHVGISLFSVKFCAKEERVLDFGACEGGSVAVIPEEA